MTGFARIVMTPLPSPYQLLLVLVALADLFALMLSATRGLSAPVESLLGLIDLGVCAIFFADFLLRLKRAPDRAQFMKWGWIDLISCVPQLGVLRFGRVLRIVRVMRMLRAVRSTRVLAAHIWSQRGRHVLLSVMGLSALVTLCAAVAVLQFEYVEGANIRTPADAIWWAFTTVTTVGYGDRFPTTGEGRMVAAGLMVVGVGLFGTFTAFVARLFVAPELKAENEEMEKLREEMRELSAQMQTLRQALVATAGK